MTDHKWKPIEPLTDRDKAIDLAAIRPLYDSWRLSKERLIKSSEGALKGFMDRLIRRMSVETGILERIYDLDRGTTEALIAKGFLEDIVSRSSTNIEPSRLIDILRDQEAAIQLVMSCVSGNRELTKGVIHELHSILTRHQDTTTAVDPQGNRVEIPLLKGKFKVHPNNPKRPDGSMHEYCPPVQVDSEIDRLLDWLKGYSRVDPVIVAAWLHHRFTEIHPYQDGNGRVARALMTLVLLRAELLPLVVDRDLRTAYITALESADSGDLAPLSTLLARLERAAILQALSVDADAEIGHEKTLTAAVLESLAAKLNRRSEFKQAELRKVNEVAAALRGKTRKMLEQTLARLGESTESVGKPEIYVADGGPDRNNAHWYRFEVVKSANESGKFANFVEAHYFVKGTIRVARERLVFVVSFHHVGRELTGIMEATAFALLESFEESEEREKASQDYFVCSIEPFVFTHQTKEEEISDALTRWLDAAIAVGIKEYGDRL
ncbi:MAG: Fic family protein [Elusimicrobia bacterium]|nr:Fic family protein [Elusimicrobiota bacterium]